MRTILLAGVAIAALSFSGAVYGQSHQGGGAAGGPSGATGGAMSGPGTQAPTNAGAPSSAGNTQTMGRGETGHAGASADQGQHGASRMERSGSRSSGEARENANRGRMGTGRSAEERGERSTRETSGRESYGERNQGASERSETGRAAERTERERGGVTTGRSVGEERGVVRLGSEQRGRLVDSIRGRHVESIGHVDFDLHAGVVVPDRYHFYPLPEGIVSFIPEYRGYDYFVAEDEIVIIDPVTHRIVDVIPEG